jgi:uncharacterized membrane-anchored protein
MYTFITYTSEGGNTPGEIESRLRLQENVLRFLTIRLEEIEAPAPPIVVETEIKAEVEEPIAEPAVEPVVTEATEAVEPSQSDTQSVTEVETTEPVAEPVTE